MDWTSSDRPYRTEVGQFRLKAFDLEPQGAAAGKYQRNGPGGRLGLRVLDRQEVEHGLFARRVYVPALARQNPLEAQHRAAPAVFRLFGLRAFPIEAVERDN